MYRYEALGTPLLYSMMAWFQVPTLIFHCPWEGQLVLVPFAIKTDFFKASLMHSKLRNSRGFSNFLISVSSYAELKVNPVWILICISKFISRFLTFLKFLRKSHKRSFLSFLKYKSESFSVWEHAYGFYIKANQKALNSTGINNLRK